MVTLILLILGIMLAPQIAWAWGPIAHLDYASIALANLSSFLPAVKALLTRYPHDFLYGAIAADITVGKSYVEYLYNCHNWQMGFLLLNEAKDDRQRACAYGYLSHLSADIIAHNYFVPFKLIRSFRAKIAGHVYWEMRFDGWLGPKSWGVARELAHEKFSHNDELFQRILKRTLFSFKTNKKIFNSILNLHKFRQWEKGIKTLSRFSRLPAAASDFKGYHDLAVASTLNFLKNPEKATAIHVDPTGAQRLSYAVTTCKKLKQAYQEGLMSDKAAEHFLQKVKAKLKEGIYKELSLPTVDSV